MSDDTSLPALLTAQGTLPVPAAVAAAGDRAALRYVEFFAARIRNPNTRAAYGARSRSDNEECAYVTPRLHQR